MNPEQAHELFHRALDIADPAERLGFLKGACGHDAELMAHVQKLLASHAAAEAAFPTEPGDRTEFVHVSEGPGTQIGKYKLLQKLGEGGMGVVYMAEQREPFDKRVALKIIKLGMDTKAVVARFEAERQALALMNHPNIAKVLDAGATETGRPYFVMELVKGEPLTEYCDKHKLSTRQRLELFIPVCQAIQHAHQKGIIHRDIKPSNILVALFDGRPVPMVIDFGIAKATNQRLTQQTVFTNLGQLIGTPAYMSPEQAEGSQLDIDTRSDIYSLGVLLYELLTGSQPFPEKRLLKAGWAGMMKIIREEEPQRPSTRLSTLTEEEQSQLAGTHGGEPPRKIGLVLRRELDLVILKCLQKDRSQRYETANGLAMELERYLKGEPVTAVPPTLGYQFAKFARKHKQAVAMAAAFALVLAGATVFSTWQAIRATRAEEAQRKESEFAKTLNDFLLEDLLAITDTWAADTRSGPRKRSLTLYEAIQAAAKLVESRFKNLPETEARIRFIIGKALNGLGDYSAAMPHLQRAYELFREHPDFGPSHTNTLETKFWWSFYLPTSVFGIGSHSSPEEQQRATQVNELSERLMTEAAEESWTVLGTTHPLTLIACQSVAWELAMRGQWPDQTNRIRRMTLASKLHERASESYAAIALLKNPDLEPQLSFARFNKQTFYNYTDRGPEHFALVKELVQEEELRKPTMKADVPFRLSHVENLVALALHEFAWHRNYASAEKGLRHALSISEEQVGPSPPTGEVYKTLARMYQDKGDHPAAANAMFEAVRCMYEGKEQPGYSGWIARAAAAYAATTGDWQQTLNTLVTMREQRWPVDAHILSREILLRHLLSETNEVPDVRHRFWQDVPGRHLPVVARQLLAVPCPAAETNQLAEFIASCRPKDGNDDLAGAAAYRDDDWKAAVRHLESQVQHPWANFYLAMSHRKLNDLTKAREHLDRANRLFERSCTQGVLMRSFGDGDLSAEAVEALLLRAEAERMILSAPIDRPAFADWLAEKRTAWAPVRQKLEQADWAARKRRYPEADRLYRELEQMPAFDLEAARESGLPHKMFTVAWALGQTNRHLEVLTQMHESFPAHETTYLYELAELPWALPPELAIRRNGSPRRKDLEQRWREQNATIQGEDAMILGMLWYREAGDDRALLEKSLLALDRVKDEVTFIFPTSGKAFAAMAHWKLGNETEARRLLKVADERFHQTILEPIKELYQPWFPACIMMEMVIKEADELIDPGVVNAPHVAALPDNGWAP